MKKPISILFIMLFLLGFNSICLAGSISKELCSNGNYTCIKVKKGQTWDSLFPDSYGQEILRKVNRTNLELRPGQIVAIPNDIGSIDLLRVSPFPLQISAPGQTLVLVDISDQAFAAYDAYGTQIHWGPISGGKGWCPDIHRGCHTPIGTFRVQSRGGAGCVSSIYPIGEGGAPMPYCMFFHGGFALHGSYELPGYNASHGCVRMFPEDAQWLNHEFVQVGKTKVVVRP